MVWHAQEGHRVRLVWGRRGAREAAGRGDALVIVDVLSFSTATVTAGARGGTVIPCARTDDKHALAAEYDAEIAVPRHGVPEHGRFSLSPASHLAASATTRVVLPSPNGATCSRYGAGVPALFVGALVNATATADRVRNHRGPVTVIACGERWKDDDTIRFALEDYLGAGAILHALELPADSPDLSPEARACAAAFRAQRDEVPNLIRDCAGGRELREIGFPEDPEHAGKLDAYDAVPTWHNGVLKTN